MPRLGLFGEPVQAMPFFLFGWKRGIIESKTALLSVVASVAKSQQPFITLYLLRSILLAEN
jgi:hypothetical protein